MLFCQHLYAGNLHPDSIPENLKKNANAVVRYEHSIFEANSIYKAEYTYKSAITVLNKRGDKHARVSVFYDKSRLINDIKGKVFNSNGEIVKTFNIKDFYDRSLSSSGTDYDDNRIIIYNPNQTEYPYTIEYEFTLKFAGYISIPRWNPVSNYNLSVEDSKYTIKVNDENNFHYKSINYIDEPRINRTNNFTEYTWDLKNISAIEDEPYNPFLSEFSPTVYFAPNEFYYGGYEGNQATWKDVGKWAYQLLLNRDQLPVETQNEILQLISDKESKEDKIRALYEYLQSKTRYISIQLGIGGFQPFTAMEVDETGYGDCKALSNYMISLLKVAGIKSHYTIIGAGKYKKDLFTEFASANQMNHVIVCVPMEKDTIWLECTSQKNPFGYLSTFTDDRYALIVKPTGGELAKTIKYPKSVNTQTRTVKAFLKEDCTLNAKINTNFKGLQYDFIDHQFSEGIEEQRKNLFEDIDLSNFDIIDHKYSQSKDIIPNAQEFLNLKVNKYASISGKRMFLPLNLLNRQSYVPKKVKDRKTEVVLEFAYSYYDTIIYEIPEKYEIEFLPDTTHIISPFGEYKSYVIHEENKLKYIRINKRNEGRFPKEKYPELISFFKAIRKADRQKAILIEKI